MNQLVTIVIPVFNTQSYLKNMLSCVVNQTYKNLQIIIINDNSTDESKKIINEFLYDKRIEFFDLLENKGVSYARNIGIQNAKGEKIFFWDSDDIIELNAVEKCINFCNEKMLMGGEFYIIMLILKTEKKDRSISLF